VILTVPSASAGESVTDAVPTAVQICVVPVESVIVLPIAVQVTSRVGVLSEVMLSVVDDPVSDAVWRSGAVAGAAGAVVSIVTDNTGE
jgi:hypothetical protein